MGEPFLAEIRMFSFAFPPRGWALCRGQILPINQNQALFSLLGTTYGGDGRTNFALPDLRGRVPIHAGAGFSLGQRGGEEAHTLIASEMPSHTHGAVASTSAPAHAAPSGRSWPDGAGTLRYADTADTTMTPTGSTGSGQAHDNQPPYLVVSFCIALLGIFPSRT
jgi:microcystin-dependent protein